MLWVDWILCDIYISSASGLKDSKKQEILDKMAAYDKSGTGAPVFEEHLSHEEITNGIARGDLKKGVFTVSRENYREATVIVDNNTMDTWFIQVLW